MNWVAPQARAMPRSTGLAKYSRQVRQNGGAGSAAAATAPGAASSPPLRGARTTSHTTSAVTTPTTPTQMNARPQEEAAAIEAPKATPKARPIGGPRLNQVSEVPATPSGKSA